jgi:hypothetical protein
LISTFKAILQQVVAKFHDLHFQWLEIVQLSVALIENQANDALIVINGFVPTPTKSPFLISLAYGNI